MTARDHILEGRLDALVKEWDRDTLFLSSTTMMTDHPAFRAIVALGRDAVGPIVERLARDPSWLVLALPRITGENPVPDADAGDLSAIVASWVEWLRQDVASGTQVGGR